jgi:hypothetical protein
MNVTGSVGQPLEVVADVQAVLAAGVDEVDVVDDPDAGLARQDAVQRVAGQLSGVGPVGPGVAVELADHPVQRAEGGVRGQADPEHRDPLVPLAGQRPVLADLRAVEGAGECVGGGGLAQAGQSVDDRGPADPVRVLPPGGDDHVELVVDRGELRGAQDAEVGVPVVPGLVVVLTGLVPELAHPDRLQELGPVPGRGVHVAPALFAGQAPGGAAHSRTSNASS